MLGQQRSYFLLGQGLGEKAGDGQLLNPPQVQRMEGGREHDNHDGLLLHLGQLGKYFQERQPVEHGHVHIEQHELGAARASRLLAVLRKYPQGLLPVFGQQYLLGYCHFIQQELVEKIGSAVVINQQYAAQLGHKSRSGLGRWGKENGESGAHLGLTGYGDGAAGIFDEPLHNVEAYARAFYVGVQALKQAK